jgi:flagellar hook-length control protein FliK
LMMQSVTVQIGMPVVAHPLAAPESTLPSDGAFLALLVGDTGTAPVQLVPPPPLSPETPPLDEAVPEDNARDTVPDLVLPIVLDFAHLPVAMLHMQPGASQHAADSAATLPAQTDPIQLSAQGAAAALHLPAPTPRGVANTDGNVTQASQPATPLLQLQPIPTHAATTAVSGSNPSPLPEAQLVLPVSTTLASSPSDALPQSAFGHAPLPAPSPHNAAAAGLQIPAQQVPHRGAHAVQPPTPQSPFAQNAAQPGIQVDQAVLAPSLPATAQTIDARPPLASGPSETESPHPSNRAEHAVTPSTALQSTQLPAAQTMPYPDPPAAQAEGYDLPNQDPAAPPMSAQQSVPRSLPVAILPQTPVEMVLQASAVVPVEDTAPALADTPVDYAPLSSPFHLSPSALRADAPVIVATAPVPLASVPQAIIHAAQSIADQPINIQLDPVELGALSFCIDTNASVLVVTITAERSETLDMLRKHSDQFIADLRQQGFTGINLQFGDSGQTPHDQPKQSPQSPPPSFQPLEPQQPQPTRAKPTSGLDLRL